MPNVVEGALKRISWFNSLQPNINIYILHTVLYTLNKVLTRRICLMNNQEFLYKVIISFILMTWMRKEKLDASHSLRLKGYQKKASPINIDFLSL